jgi:DNA-binding CsgD family transcriptional regulator
MTDRGLQVPPKLESFVDNLPGNVYRRVRRPDGTYYFEYLSSGLFRQFGVDPERLLAEDTIRFDWIHPDDAQRFITDLEISAATLAMLDHRIRVVGENGLVHWARGIARPERLPDGTVIWDGLVIDVTREVEAEAALRITRDESERAHRQTTVVVSQVAERLRRPIEEFQSLLAIFDGSTAIGDALRNSLTACLDAMSLISGNGPAAGPSHSLTVTQTRRIEAIGAASLTERQREVLALLSRGMGNKEIAHRLSIAPGTVRLHVAAILRALRARNRRELAVDGNRKAN